MLKSRSTALGDPLTIVGPDWMPAQFMACGLFGWRWDSGCFVSNYNLTVIIADDFPKPELSS